MGDGRTGEKRGIDRLALTISSGFILLVFVAELITANWLGPLRFNDDLEAARTGALIHLGTMLAMFFAGAALSGGPRAKLGQFVSAMGLAPLIRILSFAVPILYAMELGFFTWLLLVSVPLLAALASIARSHNLTADLVGVTSPIKHILWFVPIVAISAALGLVEYLILRPPYLADDGLVGILVAVTAIMVTTAFFEEVYFRGFLQREALQLFPPQVGIILVTLLFTVLHVGNRSWPDLLIVFVVGWSFAQVVRLTGNVLAVTTGHGVANIMLFLIGPALLGGI